MKFILKLNYPILLLAFFVTLWYIQMIPMTKKIIIKSPNPNNLNTIYSNTSDNINFQYEQNKVKC